MSAWRPTPTGAKNGADRYPGESGEVGTDAAPPQRSRQVTATVVFEATVTGHAGGRAVLAARTVSVAVVQAADTGGSTPTPNPSDPTPTPTGPTPTPSDSTPGGVTPGGSTPGTSTPSSSAPATAATGSTDSPLSATSGVAPWAVLTGGLLVLAAGAVLIGRRRARR